MLISTGGTVIRMSVDEIKRLGRATQGVIVMRLRGGDEQVSSLAPVVESEASEGRRSTLLRTRPSRRVWSRSPSPTSTRTATRRPRTSETRIAVSSRGPSKTST